MLCWPLPYINMNQPQVYICPLLPEHTPSSLNTAPSSHLPPIPALWDVTEHWVELSASDNNPTCYLFYRMYKIMYTYVSRLVSQFILPSPSPHCICKSLLFVCVSIPALQTGRLLSCTSQMETYVRPQEERQQALS